jgi:D-arginine dehydrogenase
MIDFLVIGGGIAGISAGARLSALGQVTVLEAEIGLGYHTSGRSAAMFDQIFGLPTTTEMNRASRDYHMTANGGVLSPLGLMLIGTKDDEQAFATEMTSMEMDPMPLGDAVDMVPILNLEVETQTGYNSNAWNIDTDRLIQDFACEVRSNNGQVLTGQRVQKITRTGAGWLRRLTLSMRPGHWLMLLGHGLI